MSAGNMKLDRLFAFVDANQMQVDGFVKSIMSVEPITDKWKSYGWDVQRIDGGDVAQILQAIDKAHSVKGQPHMIVADTIKGKGVDFMELQVDWHAKGLTEEEYHKAVAQVDAQRKALEGMEA